MRYKLRYTQLYCLYPISLISALLDQDTRQCFVWSKKTGRVQTGVSILTGITKSQFPRIHRSVIFYPKNTTFVVEVLAYNRKLHSKVEVNCTSCFLDTSDQNFGFCSSFFFFFFLYKHRNHSNSGMHHFIELKFGTRAGQPKANINVKICEDSIKIKRLFT